MDKLFDYFPFKKLDYSKPLMPLDKHTIITIITAKNVIKVGPFYKFKMAWPVVYWLDEDITENRMGRLLFNLEKITEMKSLTYIKPCDATAVGLKIFDYPEPCKKNPIHGHERYASTGYCIACNKEKVQAARGIGTTQTMIHRTVHKSNIDLANLFFNLFEKKLPLEKRSRLLDLKKELEK